MTRLPNLLGQREVVWRIVVTVKEDTATEDGPASSEPLLLQQGL